MVEHGSSCAACVPSLGSLCTISMRATRYSVLATATVLLAWPGGRLRLNNRDPDGPGAKTTYPVADAGSNAPRACGSPFISHV